MIRILLVDDQKSIRERLKSLLETEPDFDIVGMVDNGYDAIEQVKLLLPDVVLMDMEMPDIDGVLATKIISHSSRKTKVLVLSSHDSDEYVAKSIYAGANGYILKGAPAKEICDAVRFVNRGYMQIAPGLFEKFVPNQPEVAELEWPTPGKAGMSLEKFDYPGGLELTGINKATSTLVKQSEKSIDFDKPSELILDITNLSRSRRSLGWYQAAALVVAGLGLTFSLYLLRQGLNKPAATPSPQERSQQLHDRPFTGKIEPKHLTKIDATIPGIVAVLPLKVGQTVNAGDRLLTIRNSDAERANQTRILQQQQLDRLQQQAAIQQAAQQQQQFLQQQQLLMADRQAAADRALALQQSIANYQSNLAPLQQAVIAAKAAVENAPAAKLPLEQKREAIARAQAIYDRTEATYQRMAQYQQAGAISQERVEQAEKEMTVAKSDLNIAKSDYESLTAAARDTSSQQANRTKATALQQQLALQERDSQIQQLQIQLKSARTDYQKLDTRLQQLQQQQAAAKQTATQTQTQSPLLEPTKVDVAAPVAGMAIEIPVARGDRVFVGTKLASITNPKYLKIGVEVEPQQAALLKSGQRAIVKVGSALDSQQLTGTIVNIAPPTLGANADNRSLQRVEVEFINPKSSVIIGQNGTVYFPK